jgi:putative sterol carrier protein|tara:strand:- start:38 stop:328 length:291 start_codon:yes stop_codon:yes gene_type:complete
MSNEIEAAIKLLEEKISDEKLDGSIKFQIESLGSIIIENGIVEKSDRDTDCTLLGDIETFKEILAGDLNSTTAFMSGRLKIEGSMTIAMQYNRVFS